MVINIFGVKGCVYCQRAVQLCRLKGFDYVYSTVGQDITLEALESKIGPFRTYPQIIIHEGGKETLVQGGYAGLKEFFDDQDALQAYKDFQETGLHNTLEEVEEWLESWGTENELPTPVPHK